MNSENRYFMAEIIQYSKLENTVEKGEIANYKQILLFPHCFQKACFQGASKGVIVWEWVDRHFLFFDRFHHLSHILD